ncbi:MAG: 1,4-dihydroxy-2-naphthoate octaprenyltransferase [Oleispira sp.]|nr:1,4-dihydroxy-2-naphthoate octaprenyltransferase [Oleispira sp.]
MSSNFISLLTLAWHTIRAKTLTVALAVVVLSQSLAWYDLRSLHQPTLHSQSLDFFLALIILACCLFLQISVNLANDYFDGLSGIDTPQRLGPQRATQSGLIKPLTMRNAIFITTSIASIFGCYLILKGGWTFFFLGLLSLMGVYAYSGGKKPLASLGLGEVAVFLYFGYLAVMASYVLQTGYFNSRLFLPATQIGLLISAIMLVNNIRDIESDKAVGKNTLAVRIGSFYAKKLYCIFIIVPFLLIPFDHYQPYLNYLLIPVGLFLCIKIQQSKRNQGTLFNQCLGQTSAMVLAWSLLYLGSLALG